MWNAALLTSIEEHATAILILAEGLEEDELRRSRLTRREILRHLDLLASALRGLPPDARAALPEIDWAAWSTTAQCISQGHEDAHETLWFAVRALVPATLMWLRVYRQNQPQLFEFRA